MAPAEASAERSETGESLGLDRILRMIPHRYPFLMIDAVRDLHQRERAVGIKNVTINEPHFTGHFPNHAIMPGVLAIEAMAQTAAVLVVHSLGMEGRGMLVYFMTIDEARFRKPVLPGDRLELHVAVERNKGRVWRFKGEGRVDGVVVSEATFSAMIMDPPETPNS
ncbi:3-hydroxyacyl-ACP dehydratase FabZ [Neomegalonema perideroedes]|uniref:3-hydroxyacyl-ACP dehydratase FabZ n=1 Tax=Neomegalonema perideroedes TaxID=217219 RepID=UPI000377762F|nr:3-hydroxyacyl-ACP dehydratase FabZ [Neomegalonema perideroedes]